MGVRDTSMAALASVDLQRQERELLGLIRYHYQLGKFTRKELSARTGWTINVICGRVHSLIEKGALTEYGQTRDGGHLLSLAQPTSAAPAPAPAAGVTPLSPVPAAAEPRPHEQLIHTHKRDGTPFSYTAVGFGPGWPPDQDHLHRGRR